MKKRLDILVTERGLAESREKAKTLIMAGLVYVDNQKDDKPGGPGGGPRKGPAVRQPGRTEAGEGHEAVWAHSHR